MVASAMVIICSAGTRLPLSETSDCGCSPCTARRPRRPPKPCAPPANRDRLAVHATARACRLAVLSLLVVHHLIMHRDIAECGGKCVGIGEAQRDVGAVAGQFGAAAVP